MEYKQVSGNDLLNSYEVKRIYDLINSKSKEIIAVKNQLREYEIEQRIIVNQLSNRISKLEEKIKNGT